MTRRFRAQDGRAGEEGIAMIVALFMVLLLSAIGSSMMFVSRTETLSSFNYKTLSQARYAAESAVQSASNHLLYTYAAPSTAGADPIGAYDMTTSPVRVGGAAVVLSSDPDVASNYPVAAVRTAFLNSTAGTLTTGVGTIRYVAVATLVSMRQITDGVTGNPVTLQTWEITGRGIQALGAADARIEVSSILERQEAPVFRYAAFAQDSGCEALMFGGGATTDSYDSRNALVGGVPVFSASGGNVGTNGNLTELGSSTTIHGTLSTPRTGVGTCSDSNVTALTLSGTPKLDGGVVQLPQAITWPTPAAPSPAPPTTTAQFTQKSGCAGGLAAPICVANAGVGATLTPASGTPVVLGDLKVTGGATLTLNAGTYIVNSLSFQGNSDIKLGSGPVVFQVAGSGSVNTPIDFTGGSITNPTFQPDQFRLVYGGNKAIKLTGGAQSAALVYAPNASASFGGLNDFFGSVIANKVTDMGGASIHYDRALQVNAMIAGNPTMSGFTWRSF